MRPLYFAFFLVITVGPIHGQISFDYDDLGRLTSATYPCATTTYDYDAVGALEKVTTEGQVSIFMSLLLSNGNQANSNLPQQEPYTALGYSFVGEPESGLAGTAPSGQNYVDWVIIELRDAQNPAIVVASKAALLTTGSIVVDPGGGSTEVNFVSVCTGNYYVAVKHRNHLGVMTENPISFNSGTSFLYFKSSNVPTYGTNARRITANGASLWPGDTNFDGKVVYVGADSDVIPISSRVLTNPGNPGSLPFLPVAGYASSDSNLDGTTVYIGNNSDVISVSSTVINHPSNPGGLPFLPIFAQLP